MFAPLFLVFGEGFGLGTVVMAGIVALNCASSAVGSLALARWANDRELLEDGEKALGVIGEG